MKNTLVSVLKAAGLKVTPARKLILSIFSSGCGPINAEQIYTKVKSKEVNRVTVYRTVASLEEAGIVRRVDLRKDSVFYELADHHHHLVCTECGATEGFESCSIEDISKQVLKKSKIFKTVDQHSLELFGLCTSCARG